VAAAVLFLQVTLSLCTRKVLECWQVGSKTFTIICDMASLMPVGEWAG
jgi:hypothetical protein